MITHQKSIMENENLIKKILLEMLLYEFRNLKFSYNSQNIIKSHKFFEYATYLENNDFINICKNGQRTFYILTDWGRLHAICFIKRTDCPKEYLFLNREVWYDY